jgi:SAM-dependent methyltransferase
MSSDNYLNPYRDHIREHGGDHFDVTLWASPFSQRKRFLIFTQMQDFKNRVVLDAGCSLGDFAAFLVERNTGFRKYIGIDGLPEVIKNASARGIARSEFQHGDFLANPMLLRTGLPDTIVISGALNTMTDRQAMTVLQNAWRATSDVLIFNFLSGACGEGAPLQDTIARRLDTHALLKWATDSTPYVQFRQDYFRDGHDATIFMSKSDTSTKFIGQV